MEVQDGIINHFTTRMRQMILLYKEKAKENKELYEMVDERENTIRQLKEQLAQAQRDYESLKMAKMLQVTDADIEITKARVMHILRDINKCITLINERGGKEI